MRTCEWFNDMKSSLLKKVFLDFSWKKWDLRAPSIIHSDITEQDESVCESEHHASVHPDTEGQISECNSAMDLGLGRGTSSTESSSHK